MGFLAVPTLTGSSAYAFAETFHWREGLDLPFKSGHYFYGVVILSTLLGIGMDFAGINPIKALFWTAIINGLLAPFLLVGILIAAADRKLSRVRGCRESWSESQFSSCSARVPRCLFCRAARRSFTASQLLPDFLCLLPSRLAPKMKGVAENDVAKQIVSGSIVDVEGGIHLEIASDVAGKADGR